MRYCKQQRRQAPSPMMMCAADAKGAVCILYSTTEPSASSSRSIFDEWERSIVVNFTAQLRVLHTLWPLRRPDRSSMSCFLAVAAPTGRSGTIRHTCVSKIALIKMCELIDDEASDATRSSSAQVTRVLGFTKKPCEPGRLRRVVNMIKVVHILGNRALLSTISTTYARCMLKGARLLAAENFSTVHDRWRDGGRRCASELI